MKSHTINFALLALLLFLFFGAASGAAENRNIVTTTGMITDIVQRIAGKSLNVTGLMGAGVDPHLYKPTRSDIAKLSSADAVFYNGLLLEGKMTDTLQRIAASGRRVYAVTEKISPDSLLHPEEFSGHPDPHVWMDPMLWLETLPVITQHLSEIYPSQKEEFKTNSALLAEELRKLHDYAEQMLHSIPAESRILITAHDAFHYFGKRYALVVRGIQGLSTESEAGVRDIESLVSMIVERKISAVFVESTVSQRNIQALIEGAQSKGHSLTIGGELFSDAMGKPGTYEGTYIGMIDHNVTTIARSLGGEAPKRGMNGKLSPQFVK
ncbi:MAG: zinc ABC transporter substrate-binding protein [Bdellovibrionales bacterium]|nr:zinc ABC transporter substrate-binding protein [Bdellovibrionales bacterium]